MKQTVVEEVTLRDAKRFILLLGLGWSLVILASLYWNYKAVDEHTIALATENARTAVAKDIIYRKWVAEKGGVYAPVSDSSPPNPWLDEVKVSGKVIETTEGRRLTLINPAYMTRQVHELSREHGFADGHLTSLNPIRPGNAPDAWEAGVLKVFEQGGEEFSEVVESSAGPLFRYMKALYVAPECMLCHRHQGYQVGDVRGGLSVTLPMPAQIGIASPLIRRVILAHGSIWGLGLLVIVLGGRKIRRQEGSIIAANHRLENEICLRRDTERELKEERDQQISLTNSLKGAQSQLVQSEKLAVIGTLAAGIAHEINNPTGYVLSNLKSMRTYFDELKEVLRVYEELETELSEEARQRISELRQKLDIDYLKEDIDDVISESNEGMARIKKIVADLKDFSHANPEGQEWQFDDLHKGLDSTLNLVWNELKYKSAVIKDYAENMPLIECDLARLNQVFMNLLVNASHAIEKKGEICIRTRLLEDRVLIEISDNGCGIAPEKQAKIFDPFFTTKPVGKGTGLGLSIARSIIEAHQGEISLTSTPGQGSSFRIEIPISRVAAETLS